MRSGFNFDALKAAANSFVQSAASTAKDLSKAVAQEVVGAKCLLDYSLQGQVASAGPGCLWKIYRARAKKEGKWQGLLVCSTARSMLAAVDSSLRELLI